MGLEQQARRMQFDTECACLRMQQRKMKTVAGGLAFSALPVTGGIRQRPEICARACPVILTGILPQQPLGGAVLGKLVASLLGEACAAHPPCRSRLPPFPLGTHLRALTHPDLLQDALLPVQTSGLAPRDSAPRPLFSPGGEAKCVRGPSVQGARRSARGLAHGFQSREAAWPCWASKRRSSLPLTAGGIGVSRRAPAVWQVPSSFGYAHPPASNRLLFQIP